MQDLVTRPAVVVLTGYGTIQSAVDAMKLGASDYAERYWLLLPSLPGSVEPTRREEFTAVAEAP